MFADFIIDMEIKTSKEKIDEIIKVLEREISTTGYQYKSITIITTLFTLLVSTALTCFIKPLTALMTFPGH